METSLDIDALMDACAGDREVAVELVGLFCEATGPEFSRLESAAAGRNASELSAAAHKCAGSSGTCGMLELARHLRELEVASADGIPPDLDARMDAISREKEDVRRLLHETFQQSFEF